MLSDTTASSAAIEHLRWALTDEIGPILFGRLIERFGSAQAALGATSRQLTSVEGIGPKIAQTLNDLGFYHFDQIAGWGDAEVAWVDSHLETFKGRITRDDWVGQARRLGGQ